jgi:hypothetical protein
MRSSQLIGAKKGWLLTSSASVGPLPSLLLGSLVRSPVRMDLALSPTNLGKVSSAERIFSNSFSRSRL